jgi:hypothetical protein
MGGPYLESGESIVLTTDRVSIDAVMYQAMLTTRRLILIDSRNSRFEPGIVPISAIQTVRSGKAATNEPVIVLTLHEQGLTGADTRVLIFSQEPGENRKPDRDLWVKTFIELSISGREVRGEKEIPAVEEQAGMRPSIRRWVAPDIIRPRTDNFPVHEPAPEITFSMEDPAPASTASQVSAPSGPVKRDEDVTDEEKGRQDILIHATRTAVQSLAKKQPEETLVQPEPVPPGLEMPEPPVISSPPDEPSFTGPDSPSPLSVSILAAVKSLTAGNHQEPPGPALNPFTTGTPDELPGIPYESPVRFTSQLPDNTESFPVIGTTASSAGPSTREETGSGSSFPVYEVVADGVRITSQLPEIPPETPEVPEPPLTDPGTNQSEQEPAPEPAEEDSASWNPPKETVEDREEKPEVLERPAVPASHPAPPADRPAVGQNPILISGIIVLSLLLVIALFLLLPAALPQDSGKDMITPTPAISPAAVQTPLPPANSLPTNGTWVRIVSSGYFTGQVGNPDSLQQVSGSEEKWFRVRDSRGLVKVSADKQEYTGDELRVEVYSEGRLITSRVTSAPRGAIDLLIDPATGNAPGISDIIPADKNATGSSGRLEYL